MEKEVNVKFSVKDFLKDFFGTIKEVIFDSEIDETTYNEDRKVQQELEKTGEHVQEQANALNNIEKSKVQEPISEKSTFKNKNDYSNINKGKNPGKQKGKSVEEKEENNIQR